MLNVRPVFSPVLGKRPCRHAFSTRQGGISSGVFESLNFGNPGEIALEQRDPATNIARNVDRLLESVGMRGRELVQVHQVHGAVVHEVRRGRRTHEGEHDTRADAIVTDDPARVLAIRVADCAPVLLASSDGRVVGTVHAGWRGVVEGVVSHAVERMAGLGAPTAVLAAAIGPCISAEAFEVGPEVAAEFRLVFGPETRHVRAGARDRSLVDLKGSIAEQLARAGLSAENIDVLPHCTAGDSERFFSHRRDRGVTGRMVAVIGSVIDG